MSDSDDIDHILRDWPFEPEAVSVRLVQGDDGRDVIQMRIDMGVLQLEVEGRPDGQRPQGSATYRELLLEQVEQQGAAFQLDEEQCLEIDREFVQFYHRRICWLALRQFARAVKDADHTLGLMDFCLEHSPDDEWTMAHEQYRPFVMFHRIQAAALRDLDRFGAEEAVQQINLGLDQLRELHQRYESEEVFEENELVGKLIELRESLREQFHVGRTLEEQLEDAVAAEQYELAAQIRDKLASRRPQAY
jgi:hypothetical protein